MAVVGRDEIESWLNRINQIDNLDISFEYILKLVGIADFDITDRYCLVTINSSDMFGNKFLSVVGYYILPEYRNISCIREIFRKIDRLAKIHKVKYIYQVSHYNEKLNRILVKQGYSMGILKKEIL